MKTLITFVLMITMVIAGLSSYHLFRLSDYNVSALLTITSYFSIVMIIYALTVYRPKRVHQ